MSRASWALGAAVAGLAGVVSYVLQRLSALGVAADPTAALAVEHIPFYWRFALAVLHAAGAGLLVAWGVREAEAHRWLQRLPAVIVALCVSAMVAMWVWP
ncbi:MAG: hypothetical protein ACON5B_01700 [Myxococcota bacterium]